MSANTGRMAPTRLPISFIATDSPEEARTFYADVLGMELLETTPFALVFSDCGQTLRVQIVSAFEPASYTVHGWSVSSISKEIEALTARGVNFQKYNQLSQDEQGVWTTPDGHKVAWLNDPSGNILSLTQSQPQGRL